MPCKKKNEQSTFTTSRTCSFSHGGQTLLEITSEGMVNWHGPPSKGAKIFINAIRSSLDLEAVGMAASEKIYRRAMERCLKLARNMTHSQFISAMENELQKRLEKSVLLELRYGSMDDDRTTR
jgi:hypothetical protein